MSPTSVVFPAPFGPISARISPGETEVHAAHRLEPAEVLADRSRFEEGVTAAIEPTVRGSDPSSPAGNHRTAATSTRPRREVGVVSPLATSTT